jgi:hypothetical protein
MGLGGDRFGLGTNWLQHLEGAYDDQGREAPVRAANLPPMFRPRCSVHRGGQAMRIQVDVGSLGVGEKFWSGEKRYEVMRNGGGKYIQAHGVNLDENRYFDSDEEVEVERDSG